MFHNQHIVADNNKTPTTKTNNRNVSVLLEPYSMFLRSYVIETLFALQCKYLRLL